MNRLAGLIIVASILSILIIMITPGCDTLVTEISNDTVTIAGHPTASFTIDTTVSKTFGCAPLTVKFLDISDGPRNQWIWSFGDGEIDTVSGSSPSHTYDTTGLFTVTLTIKDDSTGGTDTETKYRYIVVGATVAEFLARPDSGCAPLTVDFLPQNFGGIVQWDWAFGYRENNIWMGDTVKFPVFEYKFPGIYVCTLTAIGDSACNDTVMVIDTIKVMGCPYARIGIVDNGSYISNAGGIIGCIPFTVSFIDSSDPGDSGIFLPTFPRQWDFGNGNTSTFSADSTLYNSAGVYWVKLSVEAFDTVGQDLWSGTDIDSIKVTAYNAVTADFRDLTSRHGCSIDLPFTVFFEDWSVGNVVKWQWDFGDTNSSASGADPIVSHEFTKTGSYAITLTVGALCGDSSDTVWSSKTDSGFVIIEQMPTAGFTMDIDTGCAPLAVTFTNTSIDTNNTPTWSWSFGDTLVSTQRDTTVTFDSNGKYIITLAVGNGACTTSTVDTVFAGPVAGFSADTNIGPAPLTVTFTDLSVLAETWEWDFGVSGTSDTSSSQNPTFTFDSAGTFTVSLLVTGCGLQKDSTTIEIAVQ